MIHQWIYLLSLNSDVRQQLEKAQHILMFYSPCVEEFHSLVRRVRALCVGRFLFVYRIRHIRGFIKCYSLILKHPWSCIKNRDVLILMIRGLSILCYRFKRLTLENHLYHICYTCFWELNTINTFLKNLVYYKMTYSAVLVSKKLPKK